ncbi:glyoxylate reductase [candidate division TA06 bacterium DG_78]|uniref:Glyoxylate reductase n=1 Tax=candidate division TA06 bacterium DG_78 TaxID=1703772 RepID=A0A0S7YIT1_UNCT6|nr:MAG: glyoxylate reductase [candidate division TA06 bacterium DG_78]
MIDTRPKVLLTKMLPQAGIDSLKKRVELEIYHDEKLISKKEIIERMQDKNGLICLLGDPIDAEVISAGKKLKIIANYAVGYNNIDIKEATRRKIAVTNTPGVLTETTADLTFSLILSVARKIVEADTFVREGKFIGWEPMLFLGSDVHHKTLGIIGLGRIGRAVANRARGFGMRIIYFEPERLPEEVERECGAEYQGLDNVLKESDIITVHVPLTESTHHLIAQKEFSLMKKGAYVINVSRGPVVDEKALVEALRDKKIAGCALDVFEREPKIEQELLDLPNTVLVPHIGSASVETRTRMAVMVAENIIAVLIHGCKPPNLVNPEIYQ